MYRQMDRKMKQQMDSSLKQMDTSLLSNLVLSLEVVFGNLSSGKISKKKKKKSK